MGLIVESPGVWATVQDLGRPGHRVRGVPVSGAFDRASHVLANALLGNPAEAATLELTLIGGTYRAETTLGLSLFGAPLSATIVRDDGPSLLLSPPQSFTLHPRDRLILGGSPRGLRAYLAARGGWQTPIVLGSLSREEPIRAGDRLPALTSTTPTRRPATLPVLEPFEAPLRIIAGPDFGPSPSFWKTAAFAVDPSSDRMGLRLQGPEVEVRTNADRASTPVVPGAMQVAGGRLIALGPACGTMGGYPVVGCVISADLDRLAQARPGDTLRFHPIERAEALHLGRERDRTLSGWASGWRTLSP